MKNHAFLIATHAFPEQLEDIVNLLEASNHFFFIHIDKKSKKMLSSEPVARLKRKENVIILDSMAVYHAGFSQVACTLRLFEEAYRYERCPMDYFHLISGQDYPCMSNSDFDAVFEHHEKSFMHFDTPEEIEKYRKRTYPLPQQSYVRKTIYFRFIDLHIPFLPSKIRRVLIKSLNLIARIYKREPINDMVGGWNWFSWHRQVVEYVLEFVKNNQKYIRRFNFSYSADELIFHTILYDKADKLNIKNDSLRFVEWHPREGETLGHNYASRKYLIHPRLLDEREYDKIVKSGAIFCRKIHPVHSAKLVALLKKRTLCQQCNEKP